MPIIFALPETVHATALPCPALPCPALTWPGLPRPCSGPLHTLASSVLDFWAACPAQHPSLNKPHVQLTKPALAEGPWNSLCMTFSLTQHPSTAGEQASVAYLWAQISPDTHQIAADAGTCSILQSQNQLFLNNFASIAGGAVYATDLDTLQIVCSNGTRASAEAACTSWSNNTVQAETVMAADGSITQLQVSKCRGCLHII